MLTALSTLHSSVTIHIWLLFLHCYCIISIVSGLLLTGLASAVSMAIKQQPQAVQTTQLSYYRESDKRIEHKRNEQR